MKNNIQARISHLNTKNMLFTSIAIIAMFSVNYAEPITVELTRTITPKSKLNEKE